MRVNECHWRLAVASLTLPRTSIIKIVIVIVTLQRTLRISMILWFSGDRWKVSMIFEKTVAIECLSAVLTIAINGFC